MSKGYYQRQLEEHTGLAWEPVSPSGLTIEQAQRQKKRIEKRLRWSKVWRNLMALVTVGALVGTIYGGTQVAWGFWFFIIAVGIAGVLTVIAEADLVEKFEDKLDHAQRQLQKAVDRSIKDMERDAA